MGIRIQNAEIRHQISQIEEAMKVAGIWSETVPDWVHEYLAGPIPDVWQWLQFVYLPLRKEAILKIPHYLAPQIRRHLRNDVPGSAQLIQCIVELDSLSSTLNKS